MLRDSKQSSERNALPYLDIQYMYPKSLLRSHMGLNRCIENSIIPNGLHTFIFVFAILGFVTFLLYCRCQIVTIKLAETRVSWEQPTISRSLATFSHALTCIQTRAAAKDREVSGNALGHSAMGTDLVRIQLLVYQNQKCFCLYLICIKNTIILTHLCTVQMVSLKNHHSRYDSS